MGRTCNTNGEKRNAYRILVGKPEGKRPLGRRRRRWVDNIRWNDIDWIDLAQDRDQWGALVNTVMHFFLSVKFALGFTYKLYMHVASIHVGVSF
jgi:hypothetical protein